MARRQCAAVMTRARAFSSTTKPAGLAADLREAWLL
jgi:hypothetical protein